MDEENGPIIEHSYTSRSRSKTASILHDYPQYPPHTGSNEINQGARVTRRPLARYPKSHACCLATPLCTRRKPIQTVKAISGSKIPVAKSGLNRPPGRLHRLADIADQPGQIIRNRNYRQPSTACCKRNCCAARVSSDSRIFDFAALEQYQLLSAINHWYVQSDRPRPLDVEQWTHRCSLPEPDDAP